MTQLYDHRRGELNLDGLSGLRLSRQTVEWRSAGSTRAARCRSARPAIAGRRCCCACPNRGSSLRSIPQRPCWRAASAPRPRARRPPLLCNSIERFFRQRRRDLAHHRHRIGRHVEERAVGALPRSALAPQLHRLDLGLASAIVKTSLASATHHPGTWRSRVKNLADHGCALSRAEVG